MSTFHGLEMAKQALFAQQSALYTTGHNISNVNTKGYSRQRVNFQTAPAYLSPGMNRPGVQGQLGTGVETGTVERIRNKFLDLQYRAENSKSGFWETKSESIGRLEQLMNEPSESGISHAMEQLWGSLQDLSTNPDNSGAKSVVAQRANAFTDALNYTGESIESLRSNLKSEIDVSVKKINSFISQIDDINDQVKQIEPHGLLANDLYDKRDQLIDELSGIVNIKVTYTKSSGSSPEIADGLATVELADSQGKPVVFEDDKSVPLLDSTTGEIQEIGVSYTDEGNKETVSGIKFGKDIEDNKYNLYNVDKFLVTGSLMGNIDSYGYMKDNEVVGTHPEMLQDLNKMVKEFADEFNTVYKDGQGTQNFFVGKDGQPVDAQSVRVNQDIIDDPESIIASVEGYGDLAGNLADVFDKSLTGLDDTSVNSYFESLIGNLGVVAQEANKMSDNVEILRSQVDSRRLSESQVSLDEEITNMMKFQHAYNAAARSMTAVDEMIDRIINNMGLVGR